MVPSRGPSRPSCLPACLGQAQARQARPIPHTGQAGRLKQTGRLPVMLFKIFNRKLHFLSRKRGYEKIKWRYL